MNAMAGDNPEARTVTEVISTQPEQAAQPGPVAVGNRQSRREVGLAGPVKGLALRRKYCHERNYSTFCNALLLSARYRTQLTDQVDHSRPNRHKHDRRQNKDHERGDHLDSGLGSLFFG